MARQIVKKGLTAAEHAALDHSEIPGAGGEETFTQEVHDLEDHSSVPGVPSIEGLLDETSHDALDHTGLTGIPAASLRFIGFRINDRSKSIQNFFICVHLNRFNILSSIQFF